MGGDKYSEKFVGGVGSWAKQEHNENYAKLMQALDGLTRHQVAVYLMKLLRDSPEVREQVLAFTDEEDFNEAKVFGPKGHR